MNYYDMKNLIKSFVGVCDDDTKTHTQNDETFERLSKYYSSKDTTQINKSKGKYIPPGGFVGYRGTSVVSKPFKEPIEDKITHALSYNLQLEKDKLNREAISKINDISKLLLQEFEDGKLVYVESKPKSTPLLTKIKKFLRLK